MYIGLFGGTFDPIHQGHVLAIREVKETYGFDRMVLIPAAVPPHKIDTGIAAAHHRLEMTRLAFSQAPGYTVSDLELNRKGPSFTIDTVRHFKALPSDGDTAYCLIMGMDAFLDIHTWRSFEALFAEIRIGVVSRPQSGQDVGPHMRRRIETYLHETISEGYTFSEEKNCFIHTDFQRVCLFTVKPVDISATDVRTRIKNGRSIAGVVPEKVADYINRKGLYR